MARRSIGNAIPFRIPWTLAVAGLAAIILGAAVVGVVAFTSQPGSESSEPNTTSVMSALQVSGSPTPTPRVIAVPGTTAPPSSPASVTLNPSPTSSPLPTAAATDAADSEDVVTPTPWIMVAETAADAPLPTATPSPLPTSTRPPPTPTAVPTVAVPTVAVPTIAASTLAQHEFAAEDWAGGFYRGDGFAYGRPWVAVYGAYSAYPRAALQFTLESAPEGPATVHVLGLDDEWPALNEMVLEVNGEVVFTGPSPFPNWDGIGDGADAAWTEVAFRLPDGTLRGGRNEIAIANLTPADSFNSPPYVLLSDAILELSTASGPVELVQGQDDDDSEEKRQGASRDKKVKEEKKENPGKDRGKKKGHKK